MLRTTWICLVVVSLIVAGCGKKADDPKKTTADTKAAAASSTPDQSVRDIAQGLAAYKPVVVWQALPPSYQKDITGLIADFAGKMDKELWNKSFAIARKAVDVLKLKKDFIIDTVAPFAMQATLTKEQLSANWDGVVNILNTIVTSEISNLDEVKKANVEAWLNGSVAKLMKESDAIARKELKQVPDLVTTAKSMKATLVKMEGDTATVKIEAEGKPAKDEAFVKVEGKWVPKEMADNWQKTMKEARDGLAQIKPEELSKNKAQILEMMNLAEKKLDDLSKAKTAEDFQKVVGEIMKLVMGGGK